MLAVEFCNCFEIRMGSPFRMCELHLTGTWTPDLERYGWLPIQARSNDGRFLALAKWDTAGNLPGFRLLVIDEAQQTFEEGQRIQGCCESVIFDGDVILWKALPDLQGKIRFPFSS